MFDLMVAFVVGCLSVSLFIYVLFTARCKGPILTNTYLFATEEERKKLDLKREYRLATVIFSLQAVAFAFLTIYILKNWKECRFIAIGLILCSAVYAIRESVKSVKVEK